MIVSAVVPFDPLGSGSLNNHLPVFLKRSLHSSCSPSALPIIALARNPLIWGLADLSAPCGRHCCATRGKSAGRKDEGRCLSLRAGFRDLPFWLWASGAWAWSPQIRKDLAWPKAGRVAGFALLTRSIFGIASRDPEATWPKQGRVQVPAVLI